MSLISNNLRSLFAIACSAILLAPIALADSGNSALASAGAQAKVDAGLIAASGDVRIYITLASNELAADLSRRRGAIIKTEAKRSSKARSIAAQNPYLFTDQERSVARSIERARNRALPALRAAAAPDVAANEQVARLIKRDGGEVHAAAPLPNSITATVPAGLIDELSRSELVSSITAASAAPHPMNSPVDGSETWHTNGYIGNGPSLDGLGGPDYGMPDAGIRTTHLAFRTRLPGDPSNGPATGPSRITSPPGRTTFTGSEHGNTVAATVANTDLTTTSWSYSKGLAYGIDKVYDPYQAKSEWYWLTGVTYLGEPGVADLPEAVNFSVGSYMDTTDYDPAWSFIDGFIASLGVTYSFPAGNCGFQGAGGEGCLTGQGPHRVGSPGTLFNTITVGGLDYNGDAYNSSVWIPWANSSPGPTWGGRKKPDVIHKTTGSAGGPNDNDDTTYENTGEGTSYAAPAASAGALLLASAGVYAPTAQKAILINTATPIQGQTYWNPKSGWGALNLETAFHQRPNRADSTITGAAENGVRFFRATGVTSGDRSTLVWNRRTATASTYHALTDLDLSQHDEGTGATTATGGSDAADTVDTDQTVSSTNPMPGSGADGSDNVEQVRSTSSGTQVLKVKALSSVAAIAAEPFSLASAKPLTALATPIPDVTLDASPATVAPGDTVTVTATINNPSTDLDLSDAEVSLSLPAGATVTGGDANPKILGTLAATGTTVATWQVTPTNGGTHNLNATADGTTYGETFSGQGTDSFLVDDSDPVPTATAPGTWSPDAAPAFSWSATDDSAITGYDVELSRDGGAFSPLLTDTTSTGTTVPGAEGERLAIRVSATDEHDNTSGWVSSATTTIDAVPPAVAIGASSFPVKNVVSAAVSASNVGSPLTSTYAFTGGPAQTGFDGSAQASFTNARVKAFTTTLTVTSTDALGRSATAVQSFAVPSLYLDPAVRIKSAKVKNGELTIRGTVVKSYRGSVSVKISRVGRVDSRRVAKRIRARNGAFRLKTALKPGRYRVRASVSGGGTILAGSITKIVRVR